MDSSEITESIRPWGEKEWSIRCESTFEINYKLQKERAEIVGDSLVNQKKTLERKLDEAKIKTLGEEMIELAKMGKNAAR